MRKKLLAKFFIASLAIVGLALLFLLGAIIKLTDLQIQDVLKSILVPTIIFLLLALGTSYLFSRKLYETSLKPFQSVAAYLLDLTKGDYSVEAPPLDEEEELANFLLNEDDRKAFAKQLSEIRENENMRRQFTANISHELKSPLTSINGYAEMLEQGMFKNDEEVRNFASIIRREGKRLLMIIDQVIELSKFDTGMVNMNDLKEFNLTRVLGRKIIELQDYAKIHNVNLYAQVAPIRDKNDMADKPAWEDLEEGGDKPEILVRAKQVLVEELLDNLITNAIKYSKEEGGKVRVRLSEDEDSVYLTVKDKGIGISKEDCEHIFERFFVANPGRTKTDDNGTGLGLSLVKHAVQAHNGSYSVQSKLGKGSKFTISLPKEPKGIEDKKKRTHKLDKENKHKKDKKKNKGEKKNLNIEIKDQA